MDIAKEELVKVLSEHGNAVNRSGILPHVEVNIRVLKYAVQ